MVDIAVVEREGVGRAACAAPTCELGRLGDEIAELAAHVHAATYQLLTRLREFDALEGWSRGFRSCAHWLSWRTGIAPGAAREKVRVARALEQLPRVSEAMRCGELSFAKVRAITRVATSENEEQLLEVARCGTAAHVEKIVRAWRRIDTLEAQHQDEKRHHSRYVDLQISEDGMYDVRARLDPEVGALLEQALRAAAEALYGRRSSGAHSTESKAVIDAGSHTTPSQRRADALGLIAECALKSGLQSSSNALASTSRAGRFEVVVHIDAEALRAGSNAGQSVFANGVRVSAETSRRLSCDASRVIMMHDGCGKVLDVGRRTRTIPPAIRRALDHRDRGCCFPGCGLRFCDAHHIVHWADGGPTRLENLVLLCRRHHRAVHEEGFRVLRTERGELHFQSPDGKQLVAAPVTPLPSENPTASLEARHRDQGLGINAWTPTPHWHGERLDLDLAILTLRRR